MDTFLTLLGMFVSVVLIGIILLQRGRGGGLVGALSGLGGQSAFGTKAGDMFTRITIGVAAVWVLLAGISGQVLRARTGKYQGDEPPSISKSKDFGAGASKSDDRKSENDSDLKIPDLDDSKSEKKSKAESKEDAKTEDKEKSKSEAEKPAAEKKSADEPAEKEKTDSADKPQESPAKDDKPAPTTDKDKKE